MFARISPVYTGAPAAATRAADIRIALALAAIALIYGLIQAWIERQHATLPLDLDGYGTIVGRLGESGRSLATLFADPSMWKGPVVPFVFGLAYFVAPFEAAPLVFNAIWFGVAAALFYLTFRRLDASRAVAAAAVGLWIVFPPHAYVFGYYYAEPFLSFLVAGISFTFACLIDRPTAWRASTLGCLAALLLLSRAPFVTAIAALAALLWTRLPDRRGHYMTLCGLAAALTFAPWPIRNLVVHDALIPFTTEGGKILFQGVWLPGDDAIFAELRRMPGWNRFEAGERGLSPPEQYKYWQALAREEIQSDPIGQVRLAVRKALRFWVYLPQHSWIPAWKTTAAAMLILPLAVAGFIERRGSLLVMMCAGWVAGLWLFHALVHSELRYNFPVLPLAFALALTGAERLASRVTPSWLPGSFSRVA